MFQPSTELGIRGLAILLALQEGGPVRSGVIGERLGVSATYITKAFQPLARMGWLRSTRGRTGGWQLIVDPTSITLAEVALVFEPDERWRSCVLGQGTCSDEDACPFHETWGRARDSFAEIMERTTLASFSEFVPVPGHLAELPSRTERDPARKPSAKRSTKKTKKTKTSKKKSSAKSSRSSRTTKTTEKKSKRPGSLRSSRR